MKQDEYDKKFHRLIATIYRLGTVGSVATGDLAREFNVHVRTIQRDLHLIERGGFPLTKTFSGWRFVEGFQFSLFPKAR